MPGETHTKVYQPIVIQLRRAEIAHTRTAYQEHHGVAALRAGFKSPSTAGDRDDAMVRSGIRIQPSTAFAGTAVCRPDVFFTKLPIARADNCLDGGNTCSDDSTRARAFWRAWRCCCSRVGGGRLSIESSGWVGRDSLGEHRTTCPARQIRRVRSGVAQKTAERNLDSTVGSDSPTVERIEPGCHRHGNCCSASDRVMPRARAPPFREPCGFGESHPRERCRSNRRGCSPRRARITVGRA